MTYQWKIPNLYPVEASTAGAELMRIYTEKGSIAPGDVVNESRAEAAPLHPCFEWNDPIAAEKYREHQAACLIRCISVQHQSGGGACIPLRAFVTIGNDYEPLSVVVSIPQKMDVLLQMALKELQAFQNKYATLSCLRPVFTQIENLTNLERSFEND